jgi:cell division protein FtsL
VAGVFDKRFRGFRVVNLVAGSLLVAIVLAVYLGKTFAGRERNEIAAVEMQIRQEKIRIRLLQAEVAHLEQPRRLQSLASQGLGMAPVTAKQEIALTDLARLKPAPPPTPPAPTPVLQTAVVETPAEQGAAPLVVAVQ